MLNRAKGPAMHSPRAQADKKLYQFTMKRPRRGAAEPDAAAGDGRRRSLLEDRRDDAAGRSASSASWPRRHALPRPGRRPDHRHLPQGAHAHRRGEDARRPGRRRLAPRLSATASPPAASSWPASRPARPAGSTAAPSTSPSCEPQPGDADPRPFSFATDRITQPQLDCHITYTNDGGPRPDPRQPAPGADVLRPDPEPRAALLPVDRGQGRALRRQGPAPDLPRAGRAATRCEYYCNGITTSLPKDVQEAMLRADPRPGERRDHALGLRRRVRLRPADAAAPDAGDQAGRRACSSPARSTARPATRRPPPRG